MNKKKGFLGSPAVQSVLSSLICILIGLLLGYIALLLINPSGAGEAIRTIILNFFTRANTNARMKALGNTLTKGAPLLMCALSVCFCYKVGLFNIGASGQYEVGACAALFCALYLKAPWYVCLLAAMIAGALLASISGILKAYLNVNEVISGIMLNWIMLYVTNTVCSMKGVKDVSSPYTASLSANNPSALLPQAGLNNLFAGNRFTTIAIPLSILFAFLVWLILTKTKFGYELRATGFNKYAAKYAGMKEKKNIIVALAIGGGLAGLGAGFMYLSGYMQWAVTAASVPGMGFNGIAATFLGGLHPIGSIFAAFFIQSITDGGALMNRMLYPSQISDLITGIIIYSCAFSLFFKQLLSRGHARREERAAKKKEGTN